MSRFQDLKDKTFAMDVVEDLQAAGVDPTLVSKVLFLKNTVIRLRDSLEIAKEQLSDAKWRVELTRSEHDTSDGWGSYG